VVNGADGMEFGLNVYYGPKADIYLQEYLNSDGGLFHEDKHEMMHSALAVCVTFEDRSELDKDDLQLIRMLAYKFRGSCAWPLFRHYEPGFSVWGLKSDQVGFLTAALEQAVNVATRFRENEELYFEHDQTDEGTGEQRLHRVPVSDEGEIRWHDEWLPWHVQGSSIEPYIYPNEVQLRQLRKSLKKSKVRWETNFEYTPFVFGKEYERPFYPRFCIWVDRQEGSTLHSELVNESNCQARFADQLLSLLQRTNSLPTCIDAGTPKAYWALKDITEKLGIKLQLNPKLQHLNNARHAFYQYRREDALFKHRRC